MKTGVIDAGGGLRGICAAGAFDRCMDGGGRFDLEIAFRQARRLSAAP